MGPQAVPRPSGAESAQNSLAGPGHYHNQEGQSHPADLLLKFTLKSRQILSTEQ